MVLIAGLIKTSLIDYPGKIAAVIFFKGCNFRCGYCYNTDLVLPNKQVNFIPEHEMLSFLERRAGLLDAVVFLGGEPTLQKDLISFAEKVKELGFLIKLDTNGSRPSVVEEMISKRLVDYIAMDVKAPLDFESYAKVTKCSKQDFENVLKSIEIIKKKAPDYEFRTTLAPGLVEPEHTLIIAKQIAPAKRYAIQNFYSNAPEYIDPSFKGKKAYLPKKLHELAEEIRKSTEIDEVIVRA